MASELFGREAGVWDVMEIDGNEREECFIAVQKE